jgi:HD-GYP domain-containing protein (c-di-GMP phosphodiesterase class II)
VFALLAGAAGALVASSTAERAERSRVARDNARLDAAVKARTQELEATQLEVVERLARAAELRDDDTGEHIDRMSHLCELVALQLGTPAPRARLLRQAATLHDVGKIGLPDDILLKPGKLTGVEREIMTRHASDGAALLAGSTSKLLGLAEVMARTHHERWDGTGYPAGLRGEEIPIEGRIAAVCDVFDALMSERPYKRAWSREEALAEIAAQRGRHFDPVVADALLAVAGGDVPPAGPRRLETGPSGVVLDCGPEPSALEPERSRLDGERARGDVPVGERARR